MALSKAKIAQKRGIRSTVEISVSDHAVARRVEYKGMLDPIVDELLEVVAYGREVVPVNALPKIFNHGFQNAKYYTFRKKVVVVVNNNIVTTYAMKEHKWKDAA